jgi:catechol 2,3-dioxygenase-like lactoylglutathione lyase family enzyme
MRLLQAIPALPATDIARSAAFYRDQLGFTLDVLEDGFAILRRDGVEIHLWAASDESWRTRSGGSPVESGAESFLAGTASCRVGILGVDELYKDLEPRGIVHPNGHVQDTEWGTREFGVLDLEGNLITFFERE